MMQLELIGAELGNIGNIAEMAIESALSGGKVYVYSRDKMGLCVEGYYRRGGMTLTQGIYYNETESALSHYTGDRIEGTSKDTVIMGILEPDDEIDLKCLDLFRKQGMKIASLGPMTRDIKIPDGRTVPKESDIHAGRMCDTYGLYAVEGFERKVCPTTGPLLNQMYWAVCMEIVERMIRRTGTVPGVLFSSALKGGRQHNARMFLNYKNRGY